MMKVLERVGLEGTHLSLIKAVHGNRMANIILTQQGGCTHGIATIWFAKQDLEKDTCFTCHCGQGKCHKAPPL